MQPLRQPDPQLLLRRVRDMIAGGRVHAARPLIGALQAIDQHSSEFAEVAARLLLREGRTTDALLSLDEAITRDPSSAELRICRADARIRAEDITGAAGDAAEAVILQPENPEAKAILGIILIEMDRPRDAVPCLREAVAAAPARASFRCGLAKAQERSGDVDAASATIEDGIRLNPNDVGLRTAGVLVAMRQRKFGRAADLAEAAQRDGVADACVFGLRGHALSSIGRHTEAAEAYGEAFKLAPEDPYVRHLVAASGILPQSSRAPARYIETVFDGYAQRFESHLISLGYRVPGLIRAALQDVLAPAPDATMTGPVLDLGCGTGLIGVVLSDLPLGPLTGVDLSGQMLAEARAKQAYACLEQADLEVVLADSVRSWRVIIAADVFCYFGVLGEVIEHAHARLQPGGHLVFTLEEMAEDLADPVDLARGWRLGRLGRYSHAMEHVTSMATRFGFAIRVARREVLRMEGTSPVDGLLFVLERTRHDG